MAGAPSQIDLFDPKPALTKHDGQDIPDEFIKGERFAFIKGTPKLLASPVPVLAHGQSGARDLGAAAPPGEGRRRHHDRPLDADDAVQPRAGADLHEHRAPGDRPAEPRIVAQLRAGQREQRSAGVRRAALGREQSRRRQVLLGQRFSSDRPSGRRVPLERRAGAVRVEPGGRRRRGARPLDRRDQRSQSHQQPRRRATPRSRRASPPTSWRIACRRACRS